MGDTILSSTLEALIVKKRDETTAPPRKTSTKNGHDVLVGLVRHEAEDVDGHLVVAHDVHVIRCRGTAAARTRMRVGTEKRSPHTHTHTVLECLSVPYVGEHGRRLVRVLACEHLDAGRIVRVVLPLPPLHAHVP